MSTTVPPSSQRLIDAYLRDLEAASVDRDPAQIGQSSGSASHDVCGAVSAAVPLLPVGPGVP